MFKLDAKDRALLHELDINSRRPITALAKRAGMSKEVAKYRLNRLVKEGVIFRFFTILDSSKLGVSYYKILIKLRNANEKRKQEIINYLINAPYVNWVVSTDGEFDLGFTMLVEDLFTLNRVLTDFTKKYWNQIIKKTISVNLVGEYLIRGYLTGKKEPVEVSYYAGMGKGRVDAIDMGILGILCESSRTETTTIARRVGISPETARKRIAEMERTGVIRGYTVMLDHNVIGQFHHKVLFYLSNLSEKREKSLHEYCRRHPNIVYMIKTLGPWDLELDIEVKDPEEYRKLMMELTNEFSDIISDYSALRVYRIHKYLLLPHL